MQPKNAASRAISAGASSLMMSALLPPSSSSTRPNRRCTSTPTSRPTAVLPVNESNRTRSSAARRRPTSVPPWQSVTTGGSLFRRSTSATIRVVATLTSGVLGAPFHRTASPTVSAIAAFQPNTAHGKLNAEMIPTSPSGFHFSRIVWPARSDGSIWPAYIRDSPTA
uniref:Putative secreted protein n=1 Tax=Anopheles triannulatus TaxID=58253 RepID=A0A2M4B1T4_9DIPT